MRKVLAAIVTFIFSVCLITATVATASAASVKKVSGFKAEVAPLAITLTWKKTSGAKGYEIQQKSGKKWKNVATIKKAKTTSYTVKKLKNGTTYQFRIRAVNGNKKGAYVSLKAKTGVQKIASVKAVSTGLTSAKITWAKANVTGYEIQYSTSKKFTKKTTKTVKIKKAKTTSNTIKKLSAGAKNYIRIRGYVSGSAKTYYGSYTTVNVTTAMNSMGAASVKSVTDSSVTVGWAKVSGVTGYQIQKLQSGNWVDVNTAVKNSDTQYTVSGLSAFADQQIRIRAYQKSGSKTFYNNWVTVNAKTNMGNASGVAVSDITASSARISWNAAGGAAGYRVFNGSTKIADVKTTSATVSLNAATTYNITVVPYNGSVTGNATSAVSFTTACAKVTGLAAGTVTDSSVALSWTAVSGAKSYQIQYSKDGKNWSSATSTATSATIKNLDANVTYTFKVGAVNQNGGKNQTGEYTEVTARTLIGVATGLKVSNITGTSATVSWTAARGAKAYRVFSNNVSVAEVTSTSVTLTLNPVTTYKVYVMGYDGNIDGAISNSVEFTTTPAQVTGVTAEKTADKALIKWTAVNGAAGYEVQYKQNVSSAEWIPCCFTEDTEFFAENLAKGTSYVFRVCAYNYSGEERQMGEFSDVTSAVTASEFFTKIDNETDILEWNAISGADAYEVKYYDYENDRWMEDSYSASTTARVQSNKSIDLFKVVAYDEDQNILYTSNSVNFTKSGYTLTQDGCKVTVKWPAVLGATKYTVTRSSQKNYKDTKEYTATTAEYYLAPGLLHRFEIYTDKGAVVAKFAVETPDINLTDTSDVSVNSQLAYLAEGINRSKYDYSHKTVINNVSEMNSTISEMKFGIKDLNWLVEPTVTGLFKSIFGDMLKGTNHKIANGYIECYDKEAVEALFGIMGDTGSGDNSTSNIKEESVATFDKQMRGTLRNVNTGKYSNIDLHKAIQPVNDTADAYIYNLVNTSAWKNGFESVVTTRVPEGYKIVAVLKSEKSDSEKNILASYHNGLVNSVNGSNIDLGMDGGESILKADMGKTTISAIVDEECRLVSYDVDMPYSMEMNVITELDLSDMGDDSSISDAFGNMTVIKLEIGVKMSGSQKSSSVFTRTK